MRILIAEDDPLARCAIESKLKRLGHEVIAVPNGKEAWEALQKPQRPSLAVLDWDMPGLSGPEVCKKIRASES